MMRIVQTIATFLLVLAGALGVAVWYINSLDYRTQVERLLEDTTGYVVSISGPLKVGLSPLPIVEANDVRVANPPWVQRPELAQADRVEVGIDLWSLLSGPVRIDSLTVHNALIRLETDATGRANWLAAFGTGGSGPVIVPDIRNLVFKGGTVSYHDGRTGQDYEVTLDRADSSMPVDGPLMAAVRGRFRDTDFQADVQGGRLSRLINDDTHWPIRATVTGNEASLQINGTVGRPLTEQVLDLNATVAAMRLDALRPVLQLWLPPIEPFKASFRITGTADRYRLDSIESGFAASDAAGTLDVDFTGAKPRVQGEMTARFLRVLDLFGIKPPPNAASMRNDGRLFDPTPVPFETLALVDVQVSVTADRLETWPMEMTEAASVVTTRDGVLSLAPFHAEMGGGRLDLRIVIDAAGGPEPKAAVQGRVEGVRLERLLPALGLRAPPEGALDLSLELSGQGNSLRALMAKANGSVDVAVGAGSLPIWGFDLIATDLIQAMMPWARHGDRTPLNCMLARFSVSNGLAQSNALLIDTTRITVAGAGAINLGTEELDFFFRPRPKDPSLLSVAAPVRVSGTLKSYKARPDAMDLAAKGAATLLLGSINPVAVIVPFLDVGTGVENPCLEALRPGSFITAQPLHRGPFGQTLDFFSNTFGRVFDWLHVN